MARDFFSRDNDSLPPEMFGQDFSEHEFSITSILKQASSEEPPTYESEISAAMDLSAFDL